MLLIMCKSILSPWGALTNEGKYKATKEVKNGVNCR